LTDKRIIRVFPRKTHASPDDDLAYFGPPGLYAEADEVHVSVTFTYDIPKAEELAKDWERVAPVKMSGPALGDPGGEFTPGMYLKQGYVITSRGCPNNCWFCDVPKREGGIRELKIHEGRNLLDSNLLACSDVHISEVFSMLARQTGRVELTGGLEAARLKEWHVGRLWQFRPAQIFFAYDTPDDLEPLRAAGKMLRYADFTRQHLRCYVLIGWPGDTIREAENRLVEAWTAGFMPCAMLYKDKRGTTRTAWKKFQREWVRPAITRRKMRAWSMPCVR